ncbi:MAG: hypothetical protein DMG97_07005 [Acidobacteria bacterium]|nr:MAG: hypothetical protein DMG97_07005 [Acidobacteriota bacterium]
MARISPRLKAISAVVLVLLLILSGIAAWGASLKAAVGKVDITPPPGIRLWGYSDRKSPATGTLDPLYARVLVLEAGGQSLALISVDLGRSFGPASLDRLRHAARNDVSFLIVAATHTHSGPVLQDEYPTRMGDCSTRENRKRDCGSRETSYKRSDRHWIWKHLHRS